MEWPAPPSGAVGSPEVVEEEGLWGRSPCLGLIWARTSAAWSGWRLAGSHHLGRIFTRHGHDVRLMSPEYVRPYVKAQKNDDRDAEGIAEAATRPTMRFVELKSQDQLDMQTLHRSRDRLVGERTALINQLRAILRGGGMVAPQGKWKLDQFLSVLMDEQGGASLSPRMIVLVADARAQWAELDRRISAFDAEFIRWVKENEEARRLTTIPG